MDSEYNFSNLVINSLLIDLNTDFLGETNKNRQFLRFYLAKQTLQRCY